MPVWLALGLAGTVSLVPGRPGRAADRDGQTPDARMLLDLDLLKDADLARQRSFLTRMPILERMRLLERLPALEAQPQPPVPGTVKER